jgi:hypothetical protein
MAEGISKLVLQQAEWGFAYIVQYIGGFPQSVQRKMSNHEGCSLSTIHDIMNIIWEVITKLHVAQLFHYVSKFQHNPQAYWYISTWHQFQNSITAEYGLLRFATFSQPYAIFITVELVTLKLLLQQSQQPAVRCDLHRDNATPTQHMDTRVVAVVSLGSSGTSTLLFVLILQ